MLILTMPLRRVTEAAYERHRQKLAESASAGNAANYAATSTAASASSAKVAAALLSAPTSSVHAPTATTSAAAAPRANSSTTAPSTAASASSAKVAAALLSAPHSSVHAPTATTASAAATAAQPQAPPAANPVAPIPALFHFECLRCGFSSKQSSKTVPVSHPSNFDSHSNPNLEAFFCLLNVQALLNAHTGLPSLPLGPASGFTNQT